MKTEITNQRLLLPLLFLLHEQRNKLLSKLFLYPLINTFHRQYQRVFFMNSTVVNMVNSQLVKVKTIYVWNDHTQG